MLEHKGVVTLNEFIKALQSIKPEMGDTPVKVIAENGERFSPSIKFTPKEISTLDISKEATDHILIYW